MGGTQREDKEEKERKSVLGERRKRKAVTPKAQTHKTKNNSFLPFLLFSLTFPFFFSFSIDKNNKALKALKSTQMMEEQDVKAPNAKRMRTLVGRGDMDAKRELAIRLIEGNGVPQNHPKAVALLEDCVALGDSDAMLILANCCALGRGMEHNAERAESLICEAANKGNDEALSLMELINDWKGKRSVYMSGLSGAYRRNASEYLTYAFVLGQTKGKLITESVCLMMNIVPCKEINLAS